MIPGSNIFVSAGQQLVFQLIDLIPKLIVAIIIWIIGKYFLNLLVGLVRNVKVKELKPVNRLIESFAFLILPIGKVLLALIVLDYLGIGRTVISAILNGLTFAIAIALGIAFGKAFEEDAKALLRSAKRELEK